MLDNLEILQVLKAQLAFLEKGGYRSQHRYPWRPNFVFEDSPTCINFERPGEPRPCAECPLMQFVPGDRRETHYPCRHIQLTSRGETVNSFYAWGTEEELEVALAAWLRRTIRKMEKGDKAVVATPH